MSPRSLSLPLAVLTALAVVGCGTPPAPQATTTHQLDRLSQDAQEADLDVQEFTYGQKAEFTARMQTQLDGLGRDLEALSAKVEASSDAAKAESRPKIQALRDQLAKQHQQLDQVRGADESTWNEVKTRVRTGYRDLKTGVRSARTWASETIAPKP